MSKKNRTQKTIEELESLESNDPEIVNAIEEIKHLYKELCYWVSYDYGLPFGSYQDYVAAAKEARKMAAIVREHWGIEAEEK